jgi:predicted dehydrogenase
MPVTAYAVNKTGGKQYRVAEGQTLLVERLTGDEGSTVELEPLLVTGDGDAKFGAEDRTTIVGTRATARSTGPSLSDQQVTFYTADGWFSPKLEGTWFTEGFQGTMGELLAAIEESRPPLNNARYNLQSLAMCFAAVRSADTSQPVRPGDVTELTK